MRPSLRERFWGKVRVAQGEGCWEWTGWRLQRSGYGMMWPGIRAHRLAYELMNGRIPSGMSVLHRCDNPPCVRPDHLFLGTQADNMRDMIRKGRRSRDCHAKVGTPSKARRLSAAQVVSARKLYASGKTSLSRIAKSLGITPGGAQGIIRGRIYKDLPGAVPL